MKKNKKIWKQNQLYLKFGCVNPVCSHGKIKFEWVNGRWIEKEVKCLSCLGDDLSEAFYQMGQCFGVTAKMLNDSLSAMSIAAKNIYCENTL